MLKIMFAGTYDNGNNTSLFKSYDEAANHVFGLMSFASESHVVTRPWVDPVLVDVRRRSMLERLRGRMERNNVLSHHQPKFEYRILGVIDNSTRRERLPEVTGWAAKAIPNRQAVVGSIVGESKDVYNAYDENMFLAAA